MGDLRPAKWTRADGSAVTGYAVGDESKPGVIVIQEWWGIDEEVKIHARKIAAQGYFALIPDLYRGKLGIEAEEAHHLMSNLDWPNAVEDLRAAARYLKAHGDGKKVGTIGFCMGGALSLASAVLVDEVDAAVFFYGIPSPELADPATLTKPVQGHFGEKDGLTGFSDPASAAALAEKLKGTGVKYQVHMYPKVGHAFLNESEYAIQRKEKVGQIGGDSGAIHDPEAVALAWKRSFEWLGTYLK